MQHVDVVEAGKLLNGLWDTMTENGVFDALGHWSEESSPNFDDEAKKLILSMTNLDPAKRAVLRDVILDRYWDDTFTRSNQPPRI